MKKIAFLIIGLLFFYAGNLFSQNSATDESDSNLAEVKLITNMHCEDCAVKIKKQLAFTKGVKFASADFETKTVYVKYRKDKTNVDKIIASLAEIGYDAKIYSPAAQKHSTCCGSKNSNKVSSGDSSCGSKKDSNHNE